MGSSLSKDYDKRLFEYRTKKYGTIQGGQLLVSIARFRDHKEAKRKYKDYQNEFKKGWWNKDNPPQFFQEFMKEWADNPIVILYGQNGSTQWSIDEVLEFSETIKNLLVTFKKTELKGWDMESE